VAGTGGRVAGKGVGTTGNKRSRGEICVGLGEEMSERMSISSKVFGGYLAGFTS